MARSKKISSAVSRRGIGRVTVAAPWERNRKVVRITKTVVSLERKTAKVVVDAVLRVGGLLREVKEELPHGEFTRWLEDGVRMDGQTARNYMAVSAWSRNKPREFAKVANLSITKIYRLLRLEPPMRRRLYDRAIAIPDTNVRLKLADMTLSELDDVIRDMTAKPPVDNPVPGLWAGARHRLAGLTANVDGLIEHKGDVEASDVAELHAELVSLAQRLEAEFGV